MHLLNGHPEQLSVQNHQKKLKNGNGSDKQTGGCKVNKGDAAYLWSAQFSLPHRPPHQHSHIGSSQLCLSSLQTTKHMIDYKKKYEQTWEKEGYFNTRPATEAGASVFFWQCHVLFKRSAILILCGCAAREDENEEGGNKRKEEAKHPI